MLADQDMGFETGDGQRHHQLLRVPKGEDRPLSLREYPGHMFTALGPPAHRAPQQVNDVVADRRHQGDFERIRHTLLEG